MKPLTERGSIRVDAEDEEMLTNETSVHKGTLSEQDTGMGHVFIM